MHFNASRIDFGSVNKVYRFYSQHSFFRKWFDLQQVFLQHKEETKKQGGD